MVTLNRSTSPLACGWHSVVLIILTSSSLQSAANHLELNWLELSDKTVDGILRLPPQRSMNILEILVAIVFAVGIALVTHPTRQSHTFVSTLYWPIASGSAGTGGLVSSFLRFSTAMFSTYVRDGNDVGWSFPNCLFNSVATLEKHRTKRRNTLQSPKKDLSPVQAVGSLSSRTPAVVASDCSSRPIV